MNDDDRYVMYLVIPTSLKMNMGKTAAAVGHAVMMMTLAYGDMLKLPFALKDVDSFMHWLHDDAPSYTKVVLAASDAEFAEVAHLEDGGEIAHFEGRGIVSRLLVLVHGSHPFARSLIASVPSSPSASRGSWVSFGAFFRFGQTPPPPPATVDISSASCGLQIVCISAQRDRRNAPPCTPPRWPLSRMRRLPPHRKCRAYAIDEAIRKAMIEVQVGQRLSADPDVRFEPPPVETEEDIARRRAEAAEARVLAKRKHVVAMLQAWEKRAERAKRTAAKWRKRARYYEKREAQAAKRRSS